MASKEGTCDVIKSEGKFVQEVLRRNRMTILDNLQPEDVLDVFIQERFFGEITKRCIRDIQDTPYTSYKTRNIIDATEKHPGRYLIFKTSLAKTYQLELLENIDLTEKRIHEENQETIGDHACTDANTCPLLHKFKSLVPNRVLDLRAVLLAKYKGMFQYIPIFPGKTLDLEELYVKLDFKRIDHDRKPGEHGKPGEQASVTSVADILTKNGKICKNILISAEAGLGKSTFCKHLVRQWCNGYAPGDATLTEDQNTLQRFELLFYINLRDATIPPRAPRSDEISELIHEQFELTDICSIAEIRIILSRISALVVMDSLDELGSSRCPKRGIHNNSCIVTTSRPCKILSSQLIDVDQYIEIVGLAENSPASLANNVLKLLNKRSVEHPTKTGDQFIRDMQTKKLQHFIYNPLLVIQLLPLWFSGEKISGNSQFEIYSQVVHHQICTAVNTALLPRDVGSGSKQKLPFCNKTDRCPCRTFGRLLWNVAKLAYHTLFNKDRHVCLVFDHEVTEYHGLSTEEAELCLKIGILTQRIYISKVTDGNKYVSFPQKTNQEFFASIFLSGESQQSDLNHIRSVISNLDRALELDNVIVFCSQVNPDVARAVSQIISVKADEDFRVQEYRQTCDIYNDVPHVDLIEKLQNIIVSATQQNIDLFLSDMFLYNPPVWRRTTHNQYYNIIVGHVDITGVKSLHVDRWPIPRNALERLNKCDNLKKLVLLNSAIDVDDIREMIVRNQETLTTLGLGGGLPFLDGDVYGERPLNLSLLGNFKDILYTQRQMYTLSHLALDHVQFLHEQCQDFSEFVFKSNSLRQIELSHISCKKHRNQENCFVLDFTRHKELHTVRLTSVPVKDISLNPKALQNCNISLPNALDAHARVLKCVESARNLQNLELDDTGDSQTLVRILPQLHSLKRIVLYFIDFGPLNQIHLSAAMKNLEYLKLVSCTITDTNLKSLTRSLPAHRVTVELEIVTVKDGDDFFERIRESHDTEVTEDDVFKVKDLWTAWAFKFNTTSRPSGTVVQW